MGGWLLLLLVGLLLVVMFPVVLKYLVVWALVSILVGAVFVGLFYKRG